MSELTRILARHGGTWTWRGSEDDSQPIVCGCNEWRGCIVDHRKHVAAAIEQHLGEVLAGEGTREAIVRAMYAEGQPPMARGYHPTRADFADAALAAMRAVLGIEATT